MAASVADPEIPCVTVEDLGILRAIEIEGEVVVAKVTPTYAGCPAVLAIELAVETALREAGFEARIERVLSPAWTTDWITERGREKLRAFGIAPPVKGQGDGGFFSETIVPCPRCSVGENRKARRLRLDPLQGAVSMPRLRGTFRLLQVPLRADLGRTPISSADHRVDP